MLELLLKLKNLIVQGNFSTPYGDRLYFKAKTYLGVDASPQDLAPDDLACAETVSDIVNAAGFYMPTILSTAEMYRYFKNSTQWARVTNPRRGDIIISPTGMGGRNGITNGHVGIVSDTTIMSNSSLTGLFEQYYTIATWILRYQTKGGYPIYYFRRVSP